MIIIVDERFNQTLLQGIEHGCQAFIVFQQVALWPFLDSFLDVHDDSDQRSSRKKLIVVIDSTSPEIFERFCNHPAVKDLPDVLIVVASTENETMQFYTTEISGDGTRGNVLVRMLPVTPPDYFSNKSKNMKGVPIRFQTLMYPPFTYYAETTPENANARKDPRYYEDDTPIFIDGTEPRLLVEFCQRKNCTIDAYFDEVGLWGGVSENRTGTGILGAVATRRADFAVAANYYWLGPYRFATYSEVISRSGLIVLVPKPNIVAPWRTPFLSFSKSLWMAVAVAFSVGVCAVWLIEKGRSHIVGSSRGHPKSLSDSFLTMIGFYMEQNAFMRNDLMACVFLFSALLFAGFMVGNLYGAGLAGIMTIPQFERAIETRHDLADRGLIFVGNDLAWMFALMPSPQAYIQKIVRHFKVVDDEYMIQHRNIHDVGYIGERTQFGHFGPVDYLDVESSKHFQLLKEDLSYQYCVVILTKTCPFKQSFNDLMITIRQSGIQYFWETLVANRYLSVTIQQNLLGSGPSDNDAVVLGVSHFLGAFLILSIGCSFASIVFCLECVYVKLKKSGIKINWMMGWKNVLLFPLFGSKYIEKNNVVSNGRS
ncbi:AAEL000089-PA [Aedes aegypti]|uniref:AAEL000089-PA n=1 Tax=Aedes aegypti TaxID=7159 RepID=Q0C753_AEDAE|nr:AAEL000089-PA [Aedes aegypti]